VLGFPAPTTLQYVSVNTIHRSNGYVRYLPPNNSWLRTPVYTLNTTNVIVLRWFFYCSDLSREGLANMGFRSNHTDNMARFYDLCNLAVDAVQNILARWWCKYVIFIGCATFAALFIPMISANVLYRGVKEKWSPEWQWQFGFFFALSIITIETYLSGKKND